MDPVTVHKRPFWRNLRPAAVLLLVPIGIGALTIAVLASGLNSYHLSNIANERLRTDNWQAAQSTMLAAQPKYVRKFAYYQIRPNQTVDEVAQFFGVDADRIAKDNPGNLIPGVTIKIRPVERPLTPKAPTGSIADALVVKDGDLLRIQNEFDLDKPIVTNLPEIATALKEYNAIKKTGKKTYRLNRAISIEGDIRVDLTGDTVKKLSLTSTPDVLASLVFDQSAVLIKDTSITSVDPSTGKPDVDSPDGRSFLRMKNGRMDIIDTKITYLGNGLKETLSPKARVSTAQQEGGTYGVSYRISKGKLGTEIVTGWVEGSTFARNHFGAYTFGASGILWRNNRFARNEVYGLDPHDDSNNALVEGNVFDSNGKHGFIVSKRCNYNIIRNNTSIGNKLHGFMLHQDSAYNLIEDNVSYGNTDNFVIYESNSNTIRGNRSYVPKSSHIRVNSDAKNTFVTGNKLFGGSRGIYLYDGTGTTYVSGNTLNGVEEQFQTSGARNTFYGGNTEGSVNYDIAKGDTVIFGVNDIKQSDAQIPDRRNVSADVDIR